MDYLRKLKTQLNHVLSRERLPHHPEYTTVTLNNCGIGTIIDSLVERQNIELLILFIETVGNMHRWNLVRPVRQALEYSDPRMLHILLKSRLDVKSLDSYGRTMLSYAAEKGNLEVVRILIGKGSNINAVTLSGATILHFAVKSGKLAVVKELVIRGANVNAEDGRFTSPLQIAIIWEKFEITRYLLEQEANPNKEDVHKENAVHKACRISDNRILELVMKYRGNPLTKNVDGWNVLHRIAHCSDGEEAVEKAKIFLPLGVNLEEQSKSGITPLHVAIINRNDNLVEYFLEHQASITTLAWNTFTPVQLAIQYGITQALKSLILHGADVNILDKRKQTPLLLAYLKNQPGKVYTLLEHGEKMYIPTIRSRYFSRSDQPSMCINLLITHLARLVYRHGYVDLFDLETLEKRHPSIFRKYLCCFLELQRLDQEPYFRNLTLYTILEIPLNNLIKYSRNAAFQNVNKEKIAERFRIYALEILEKLHKCKVKGMLWAETEETIKPIFKDILDNQLILNHISYFTVFD